MSSRNRIATCAIICCLLIAMVASVATAAPFQIYKMLGRGQAASNFQYAIGDGTNFYAGLYWLVSAVVWGDEACNTIWPATGLAQGFKYGTAERFVPNPILQTSDPLMGNLGKTVMDPLNGYIYTAVGGTGGGLYEIWPGDWACAHGINKVVGDGTQYVEGMCNDGTYIYTTCSQANSPANSYGTRQQIKKWQVLSHTDGTWGGGTVAEVTTGGWPINVPTAQVMAYPPDPTLGAPAGFGHVTYDAQHNMLYATDRGTGAAAVPGTTPANPPGHVWEINLNTNPPTCTQICAANTNGKRYNGAVRYGNQLFVLKINTAAPDAGNLFIYNGSTGSWPTTPTTTINIAACNGAAADCYSIGLKGDGTTAKYLWVAFNTAAVSFYDLYPWDGTPRNLGDAANWKNGYPVYATAVVTSAGVGGFFVENTERTMGAFVAWTGAQPAVGNLVTIQAQSSKNAAGEKVITPITGGVVVGDTATPAIKPVFVTNKNMGLATGGAGLANDGMLVTISGKVTGTDMSTDPPTFYIDDGSGVASGVADPAIGVKVLKADGTQIYAPYFNDTGGIFDDPQTTNYYAVVTGIVRLEGSGNAVTRRIDARSDADVVITVLP